MIFGGWNVYQDIVWVMPFMKTHPSAIKNYMLSKFNKSFLTATVTQIIVTFTDFIKRSSIFSASLRYKSSISSGHRHDIKVVRDHIWLYENMLVKLFWCWPSLNLQCEFQQHDVREQGENDICIRGLRLTRLDTKDVTTQGSVFFILGIFLYVKSNTILCWSTVVIYMCYHNHP